VSRAEGRVRGNFSLDTRPLTLVSRTSLRHSSLNASLPVLRPCKCLDQNCRFQVSGFRHGVGRCTLPDSRSESPDTYEAPADTLLDQSPIYTLAGSLIEKVNVHKVDFE
jgi:hypothetical protein